MMYNIDNGLVNESSLPNGWVRVRIADICDLINGRAFKPSEWSTQGLPIVRIQNLNNLNADFNYCDFHVEDKYNVDPGQLLFGWSGTPETSFGAHIWNRGRAVLNQHIFKVQIDESCISKVFLMHLLNRNVGEYVRKAHGTAGLAHITKGKFEESLINLPPLSEQHRIVAKIEQLFSDLEAGVAALQKARAQLKRYRQAVLKAAVTGKLTTEWRAANAGKIEPASVLLERIRAERSENANGKKKSLPLLDAAGLGKLPEGWCWIAFGQLISQFRSGSTAVPSDEQTQFPILRSSSVRSRQIDYLDVRFLTEAQSRNHANFLREGDLLFTRLSGTIEYVGNCAKVRNTQASSIQYPDRIFCAALLDNRLSPFAELWFSSPLARKQTMALTKSTAGHQRISMGAISERYIPLPSLREQEQIVTEVDRRLSVADEIERIVDASLAQAARLRQSILKRAFTGKLVPQDPSDEPAQKLLERLRQEQARVSSATRRRVK